MFEVFFFKLILEGPYETPSHYFLHLIIGEYYEMNNFLWNFKLGINYEGTKWRKFQLSV